jgi:hypothetical protein
MGNEDLKPALSQKLFSYIVENFDDIAKRFLVKADELGTQPFIAFKIDKDNSNTIYALKSNGSVDVLNTKSRPEKDIYKSDKSVDGVIFYNDPHLFANWLPIDNGREEFIAELKASFSKARDTSSPEKDNTQTTKEYPGVLSKENIREEGNRKPSLFDTLFDKLVPKVLHSMMIPDFKKGQDSREYTDQPHKIIVRRDHNSSRDALIKEVIKTNKIKSGIIECNTNEDFDKKVAESEKKLDNDKDILICKNKQGYKVCIFNGGKKDEFDVTNKELRKNANIGNPFPPLFMDNSKTKNALISIISKKKDYNNPPKKGISRLALAEHEAQEYDGNSSKYVGSENPENRGSLNPRLIEAINQSKKIGVKLESAELGEKTASCHPKTPLACNIRTEDLSR